MINTKKDAVWKPHPDYPFIEANSATQTKMLLKKQGQNSETKLQMKLKS